MIRICPTPFPLRVVMLGFPFVALPGWAQTLQGDSRAADDLQLRSGR
jgi:hypothetical protein